MIDTPNPGASAAKRWVVVHEFGAPSHYAAFRHSLGPMAQSLEFVELNLWGQLKSIIRRRKGAQVRKTLRNLSCLLRFAATGARGRHVMLGMAPFNPWLLPVRWMLRHADVYLHSSWPHWDGSQQPHAPLLPVVLTTWQTFMTSEVRHVLIATSLAKANLQRSRFGGAPTTVVAHSFDPQVFYPDASGATPLKRLIFVGRIEFSKGIDLILELAAKLPHLECVFIGDGPLRARVQSRARELANLSYLGQIQDRSRLAHELRQSQVLLLPSIRVAGWEELFGMVLIEAMACGAVPLTTDHVGPVEIMGSRLKALCFSESSYVDAALGQIARWQDAPASLALHREVALEMASAYTVDEISRRWSTALYLDADGGSWPTNRERASQGRQIAA